MKTFEEELLDIMPNTCFDPVIQKILVAHQAEMDNVVFQVIGDYTEPIEDTDDEVDRCNNQNFLISEQRARYKAIKEK